MEKNDLLNKLKDAFSEKENVESDYVIESKSIDNNNYLTLIAKNRNEEEINNPDFENFANLLKYQGTNDCVYMAKKLQDNKLRILLELPEDRRIKILTDMKEFHNRLLTANARTLPLLTSMIKEWIEGILK